ncbi:MAG: peptide deformylase [Solirubrobacterales bacterium]
MDPEQAEPEKPKPARELSAAEQERIDRRRAALAEIRKFGDPVLKSKATPISSFDTDLEAEAERMIELMHGSMGIGLAATQIGSMRRMLVFQVGPDSRPTALVNPVLEWSSDDLVTAEEGCLSLPKVTVDVERPMHARVSASDTSGEALLIEAAGLEARVLQHEIDHLDGILIVDRTERKQRRAALRALRSGESFAPELLEPPPEDAGTEATVVQVAERSGHAEEDGGAGVEGPERDRGAEPEAAADADQRDSA